MPYYRKEVAKNKLKAFVKAYIKNGFNGTAAVIEVWPHITYDSAKVKAFRLLTSNNLDGLLQSRGIESKNEIYDQIDQLIEQCLIEKDKSTAMQGMKLKAQLAGVLVEKSEVKTTQFSDEEEEEIKLLRQGVSTN